MDKKIFFQFITSPFGVYICSDNNTRKQTNMDVARIMVRTKYNSVIKKTFNVQINYEVYWIKVVEYSKGLVRIIIPIMKTVIGKFQAKKMESFTEPTLMAALNE